METRKETALWKGGRARGSEGARPEQRARVEPLNNIREQSTPLPMRQMKDAWAERNQELTEKQHRNGETLRVPTGTVARSESIRQKIIGHRIGSASSGFRGGRLLWTENRDLALANQPAREIGGGIFVEPLIEQRGNLLAQIGGVAEARKLIALQGIARSGEKEFPRRLGARSGQEGLPSEWLSTDINNRTSITLVMTSNAAVTTLWKSVENPGSCSACSGCAGDYEEICGEKGAVSKAGNREPRSRNAKWCAM